MPQMDSSGRATRWAAEGCGSDREKRNDRGSPLCRVSEAPRVSEFLAMLVLTPSQNGFFFFFFLAYRKSLSENSTNFVAKSQEIDNLGYFDILRKSW